MMKKDDVLRRTGTDWVVEGVTIACVVAILVSFGFYGHIDADEAFPMHYNAAGEVDGWGTRSALWIFGGVALAVCLLLTIGERFYKKFNYPVRVTEKNREWLWRLAVRMFRVVKMVIMLFFTYIQYAGIWVALGHGGGIGRHMSTVFMAVLFVVVLGFVGKMYAIRKGEGD